MEIWQQKPDLEKINEFNKNTLVEHLNIEVIGFTTDSLIGTMPVDHTTHQPFGLLHGGASVVLAETLGSIASNLSLDNKTHYAVGLDINANHIRSVKEGLVKGVSTIIHKGRSTHIWEIKIYNDREDLICISRLTMAIVERR